MRKLTLILATAAALVAFPAPGFAQPRDLDCVDFPSEAGAQAEFERNLSDPHSLDPDGDGLACEGLDTSLDRVVPSRDQFLTYVAVATALLGLLATVLVSTQARTSVQRKEREPELRDRVRQLSENLTTAATAISAIEQEVRARQRLVSQLEENAQRAEALARLHEPEVQAVVQTLQMEFRATERRSIRFNLILSVGSFILGSIISALIATFVDYRPSRNLVGRLRV